MKFLIIVLILAYVFSRVFNRMDEDERTR